MDIYCITSKTKLMKKLFLVSIAMLLLKLTGAAQTDTEFWFAAPEVMQHTGTNLDRPILLRITTYSAPATVTITIPAASSTLGTLLIPANAFQSFDLTAWIGTLECTPANTILNNGLKITSTAPVSVYYDVVSGGTSGNKNNPEAFALKGKNALGTSFRIPSQNTFDNISSYLPQARNSFDIVATENSTQVTITPSNNIVGHATGIPFTVNLNAGQTYSASATTHLAAGHLNGSLVTANKPVAITVKDDGLYVDNYCVDLAGDQILPVSKTGTEYAAIKGLLSVDSNELLFITATQNVTQIFKDGTLIATINAGQTFRTSIGAAQNATYIQTSLPAYIWQVSGSGCEVGATQLPQINCTGSQNVSYLRVSDQSLQANILIRSGHEGNFLLNGSPTAITSTMFSPVPGTGGAWVFARVNLPITTYPVNSVINLVNTSGLFHLSFIDRNNGGAGYAYFSDYGAVDAVATAGNNPYCPGENINLFANTVPGGTYNWNGPAGFSSTLQNPVIPGATAINAGWYTLEVSNGECTDIDSIYIYMRECEPQDSCIITARYCIDVDDPMTYYFDASGYSPGGNYFWDFGDGNTLSSPTGNVDHTYISLGFYTVTIIYNTPNGMECVKRFQICFEKSSDKEAGDDNPVKDSKELGELYPNPAHTEILIPVLKSDLQAMNIDAEVIGTDGKSQLKITGLPVTNGKISIPIHHLNDGVYIVKVRLNGVMHQKKFVKTTR